MRLVISTISLMCILPLQIFPLSPTPHAAKSISRESTCLAMALTAPAYTQASVPKHKFKHNGEFDISHDKAKGETLVQLRRMLVDGLMYPGGSPLFITAFFTYPGKTVTKPEKVTFGFISRSERGRFSDDRDWAARIDGQDINFGAAELLENHLLPGSGGYRETVAISIPYEMFLRIVNTSGDKVEMKIGKQYFELGKNHLEALRDLRSRMEP